MQGSAGQIQRGERQRGGAGRVGDGQLSIFDIDGADDPIDGGGSNRIGVNGSIGDVQSATGSFGKGGIGIGIDAQGQIGVDHQSRRAGHIDHAGDVGIGVVGDHRCQVQGIHVKNPRIDAQGPRGAAGVGAHLTTSDIAGIHLCIHRAQAQVYYARGRTS